MQGFNKYYPPDYDWREGKGLNKLQGTHALGNRARKLDKGSFLFFFFLFLMKKKDFNCTF